MQVKHDTQEHIIPITIDPEYNCEYCQDTGRVEVIGDGAGFEVDIIGYKDCTHCTE